MVESPICLKNIRAFVVNLDHNFPRDWGEEFFLFETHHLHSLKLTVHPNRKLVYSNHSFSGANLLLVSGRVFCSITLGLVGKRHPNRFFQANVWKNGKISGWMAQAIWTTTFLPVLCCHDSFSPFKPFWHATQRKVKFPVSVNLSSEAHGD